MGGGLPPPIFISKAPVNRLGSQVFFLTTTIFVIPPLPGRLTDAFVALTKGALLTDKTSQHSEERLATAQGRKKLMEQITVYVEANLAEKITLKMIADQFSVSVSTVTQLFQKKSETTFHHFVTGCRMEKARALILQGLPLEFVGREIGYRDHSTFYRAFRQTFGISPREYKKTMLPEAGE